MTRRLICLLFLLCGMLMSKVAMASHFRYGNIIWRVPNPQSAPLTVQFTVTTAWRSSTPDGTTLNFGDGSFNPLVIGAPIGTGIDSLGQPYLVTQYTTTHTYPAAGNYTAFFLNCCRINMLMNGASADFRVETLVSLVSGNTAGPQTASSPVIQMQFGGVRTQLFPVIEPDSDPVTCRLATDIEAGFSGSVPTLPDGATPTMTTDPAGCLMTWDLSNAFAGGLYVVHPVIESAHGGYKSNTALDFIVEMVPSPPPNCDGSGIFPAFPGQNISVQSTGTNAGGGNFLVSAIGAPMNALLSPTSGSSPLATTLQWTPDAGDSNTTKFVLVNYLNAQNLTGTCIFALPVSLCQGYGNPCSAGVGTCEMIGQIVCNGSVPVCAASPGSPTVELCDNLDNDCDGVVDNGDPGSGEDCQTGLWGACAIAKSHCGPGGQLICPPIVYPGEHNEYCNGIDDDCDGVVDNGCTDSDKDHLADDFELSIGTDPLDADSDDDGLLDGLEPSPSMDSDGDGIINALDPDSDDDGLFDGTEMGKDCSHPDTDQTENHCIPDADNETKTEPLKKDTDGGGRFDGDEDTNKDGALDPGEFDPLDPSDDYPCTKDKACGNPTSGKVCDRSKNTCVDGCRFWNGNGCPEGKICTSTNDSIGTCEEPMDGEGGAGGSGGGGSAAGCACAMPEQEDNPGLLSAALGALVFLYRRRRW